jgi:hypothetical protein
MGQSNGSRESRKRSRSWVRMTAVVVHIMAVLALVPGGIASAEPTARQTTKVFAFADSSEVGEARLVRTDDTITAKAGVKGAEPGVYTMWWIVWNTPEGCGTPFACGEADLFNPDAGLAIGFAGGAVVDSSEKLRVTNATLSEGEELTGFPYPEFKSIGLEVNETTLLDTRHAEVHLVLRSHGAKIPGLVREMAHTFNAGCVYDPPITGSEPTYGTPGPNTCEDLYFAVFPSEEIVELP